MMNPCTFCQTPLAEGEGSLIPGNAMMVALQNGFKPEEHPAWETMKNEAAQHLDYQTNMSDEVLSNAWKSRLWRIDRRWPVCAHCFPALRTFLPTDPNQMPQGVSPVANQEYNEALGWLVPMQTSFLAIIAGYFGLFAVLVFPAPIALILGILALYRVKSNPKLHGTGRAIFAIVMGAIFTLIWIPIVISFALGH